MDLETLTKLTKCTNILPTGRVHAERARVRARGRPEASLNTFRLAKHQVNLPKLVSARCIQTIQTDSCRMPTMQPPVPTRVSLSSLTWASESPTMPAAGSACPIHDLLASSDSAPAARPLGSVAAAVAASRPAEPEAAVTNTAAIAPASMGSPSPVPRCGRDGEGGRVHQNQHTQRVRTRTKQADKRDQRSETRHHKLSG